LVSSGTGQGKGYKVFRKPVITKQAMEKHGITNTKGMTSFMFCGCMKGWHMEEQFKKGIWRLISHCEGSQFSEAAYLSP
jgi:hypothetical protein